MFPYNDYLICCTFMRYSFVSRFKKVYASTGSIFRLDSMPSFMNSVAGIKRRLKKYLKCSNQLKFEHFKVFKK